MASEGGGAWGVCVGGDIIRCLERGAKSGIQHILRERGGASDINSRLGEGGVGGGEQHQHLIGAEGTETANNRTDACGGGNGEWHP